MLTGKTLSIIIGVMLTLLSSLLHEIGHLIFGLISGYEFYSIRFLIFVITKNKTKYNLNISKVPGTLGQCMMKPPKDKPLPFFWYNFGGVIFQSIFSIFLLYISFFVSYFDLRVSLIATFFLNAVLIVINLIPFKTIGNDGSNFLQVLKNDKSREAMFQYLDINSLTYNGCSLVNINLEFLRMTVIEFEDRVQMMSGYFLYLQNMFRYELREALLIIDSIENKLLEYSNREIKIANLEKYLIEILLDKKNMIENKDISMKIQLRNKTDLNVASINLVEAIHQNSPSIDKEYKIFEKICLSHPNIGIARDYVNLINIFINNHKIKWSN